MGRKPRQQPFEQGCIAFIYKHFLAPLTRYKPSEMPLKEWHEFLFHFKSRDITRYVVKRPFRMPGLLHVAAAVKVQGIGDRRVHPKTELWVRQDADTPNEIQIEWVRGHGKPDQLWTLSRMEWEFVRLFVKEAERERKKP